MNKQLDLLDEELTLSNLPSAKVKQADKAGVYSWTNFYASFSENFVNSALKSLGAKSGEVVLDPFLGTGTTLVAADKLGLKSAGIDVDPFSCLLSRAKLSRNVDIEKVESLLAKTRSKKISPHYSKEAIQAFDTNCLIYASAVFSRIRKNVGKSSDIIGDLLSDQGKFDAEVIAIVSLCIAGAEAAKLVKGSNPTWFRKAAEGEIDNVKKLFEVTCKVKNKIISDVKKYNGFHRDSSVFLANSKCLDVKLYPKADYIITSPPYLTRIDYAMKHYPYLLLLGGLFRFDFQNLRKQMIGTPKIVDGKDLYEGFGPLCTDILVKIKEHESYASSSYYFWTYHQYFKALWKTLYNFKGLLNRNGKGLIVLQDSFYKDLHIPLSEIAVEILHSIGLKSYIVQKQQVNTNMKYLNPAHQKKGIEKKSSEDVIYFSK